MGRIDDLIQQYCPEGVEYVRLGEVCDRITDGSHNPPTGVIHSEYKMISSQNIFNDKLIINDNNVRYLSEADHIKENKRSDVKVGNLLLTIVGTIGRCYVVKEEDLPFTCQRSVAIIKPKSDIINSTFLKHYLIMIVKKLDSQANGAAQKGLYLKQIANIQIPLPPLPVQEAIVEILEKFDRLSAELQAELQARKQQYEYYRNQLLTRFAPEQPVTEYSLGELGTITRGNGLQKKDFTEAGVGCIHYGQIYTRYKTFTEKTLTYVDESLAKKLLHVEKGDLVIACTSENVEDVCKCVAWLGEDTIVTGGHACVYRHNQNPKYMAYFFQTDYFFQQKKKYAYGAKVIDIKPDSIAKITIPLPSLEEQARIVAILDKFEALVNDLSQGLPAEIAAVQEQYEYYRNKLLTFKTKE